MGLPGSTTSHRQSGLECDGVQAKDDLRDHQSYIRCKQHSFPNRATQGRENLASALPDSPLTNEEPPRCVQTTLLLANIQTQEQFFCILTAPTCFPDSQLTVSSVQENIALSMSLFSGHSTLQATRNTELPEISHQFGERILYAYDDKKKKTKPNHQVTLRTIFLSILSNSTLLISKCKHYLVNAKA